MKSAAFSNYRKTWALRASLTAFAARKNRLTISKNLILQRLEGFTISDGAKRIAYWDIQINRKERVKRVGFMVQVQKPGFTR